MESEKSGLCWWPAEVQGMKQTNWRWRTERRVKITYLIPWGSVSSGFPGKRGLWVLGTDTEPALRFSGNRGREGRQALQVFCSKAGEETGELWLSDRKENEDHLLDSQDYIASRFPGSEYLWVWWQTFLPLLKIFFFQNQTGMGERNFWFHFGSKGQFLSFHRVLSQINPK